MTKALNDDWPGCSTVANRLEVTGSNKLMLVLPSTTSTKKRHKQLIKPVIEWTTMPDLAIDYTGYEDSPFELNDPRIAYHFSEVVNEYI